MYRNCVFLAAKLCCLVLLSCWTVVASAQAPPKGVSLLKQLNLGFFGSDSGNDCWGYVSPSGREYAIMGLDNKVAFVEITNPASPVLLTTIPHTSSTWGDIKVLGHYAYAVTEASGTGIQVIDMSLIDSGTITLVKTIASPGRTHNLALDPVSKFLYTCGSRDGTGTTMCFNLADPANPVRVGPNSMTTSYQHDANVVTYTSGPLAGKQLWFGCSEDRGVDIYDFTDKNNPVRIKRITYPNMGYCHQAWLSDDRKYLYVDDELDESNEGFMTRSLIFNVEDPVNAFFVGTFTSGLPAIDHNQYVVDGFTLQANYRSGLRIFDLESPTAPVQTGWYDTYPSNNNRGFDGAWSNYPFFPSGIVIVSDINGGLFIVDASEALTRYKAPVEMGTEAGGLASGSIADLNASDDSCLVLQQGIHGASSTHQVELKASTFAYDTRPQRIKVLIESRASIPGLTAKLELFDWTLNAYVLVDSFPVGMSDGAVTTTVPGNPERFVSPTTRKVDARIRWYSGPFITAKLKVPVDQVQFQITR